MIVSPPTTSSAAPTSPAWRRRSLLAAPLLGGFALVAAGLIGIQPASAAGPTTGVSLSLVDSIGNSAEFPQSPAEIAQQPGDEIGLIATITNTGTDPLDGLTVTSQPASVPGALTGLTCTFPDATTGVTWAGPFAAGATFTCTANLGLQFTTDGSTTAAENGIQIFVNATGSTTDAAVGNSDPYYAMEVPPGQVGSEPITVNATQSPGSAISTASEPATPAATTSAASGAAATASSVTTTAASAFVAIDTGSAGPTSSNTVLVWLGALLMSIGLGGIGLRVARTRLHLGIAPRH